MTTKDFSFSEIKTSNASIKKKRPPIVVLIVILLKGAWFVVCTTNLNHLCNGSLFEPILCCNRIPLKATVLISNIEFDMKVSYSDIFDTKKIED